MTEVKLHGTWASPFSFRVVWALKLKGIPYDYVEEDIPYNKSKLLLQHNPVHKKIPVLVHGGKPICESMIIVEYIDETWPSNPLLPSDPYERAQARFWINYANDKGAAIWRLFRSRGDEQEKFIEECLEMLRIVEEQALGDKKFFGGDEIGIVDIAFGDIAHWLGVIEETVGVKLLGANEFPRLHAWTNTFKEAPVIRQNLPDRHDMLVLFKGIRARWFGYSSSSGRSD
ncbi:hypothetical protein FNV43_RR02162 [Rhamnella rubrinervis]|uniref:glutathione transferase n=1 Tax=Rhamnella rubrinervis TaxID=2594499 RepID=A0A8K0MTI5_9ROSA|nr:hypothetical protein FNV43_RR02162 [Rhamnella rubrinervis]